VQFVMYDYIMFYFSSVFIGYVFRDTPQQVTGQKCSFCKYKPDLFGAVIKIAKFSVSQNKDG